MDLNAVLLSYALGSAGYVAANAYVNPSPVSSVVSSGSDFLKYMPLVNTLWSAGGGLVEGADYLWDFVDALLAGIPGGAGVVAALLITRGTSNNLLALAGSVAAGGSVVLLDSMTSK